MYYEINEEMAKRAKNAYSFFEYVQGSATASYQRQVDSAVELAEKCKQGKSERIKEEIDKLLDTYARKLAEYINKDNEITARVPSVMISGAANFPVKAKEKQIAALERNSEEYNKIQHLLQKMRTIDTGGIQLGDADAIWQLKSKLAKYEQFQEQMKAVNAYYRKNKTLDGCPYLTSKQIEDLKTSMSKDWRVNPQPFESYQLSNNNAEIHRLRERIENIEKAKAIPNSAITFDGGKLVENTELMRIQFIFDDKPSRQIIDILKSNGFRYAPSNKAWQRQLTDNGRYAANKVMEQFKTT